MLCSVVSHCERFKCWATEFGYSFCFLTLASSRLVSRFHYSRKYVDGARGEQEGSCHPRALALAPPAAPRKTFDGDKVASTLSCQGVIY